MENQTNKNKNKKQLDKNKIENYVKDSISYIQKNKKYFMAGLLLLLFVIILVTGIALSKEKKKVPDPKTKVEVQEKDGFAKTKDKKILELVKSYYEAYAKGDIHALEQIATPISKNEQDYIKLFSKPISDYKILDCYAQKGLEENSYLISVHMEIIFKDIKTSAPGLDFFYLKTTEDGRLYMDNLYSQFNMQVEEYAMDEKVSALIEKYEQQEQVLDLQKVVQGEYDKAINGDDELSKMVNTTVQGEIGKWLSKTQIEQYQEAPPFLLASADEAKKEEVAKDDTEKDDAATDESKEDKDTDKTTTKKAKRVTTTDRVNLRKRATKSSNALVAVPKGTTLKVIGTSKNKKWTKVKYAGETGYIKNTYLKKKNSDASQQDYFVKGDKILLSSTVNIRASMSKRSRKVGTAYVGDTVKVVMSYDEGWTKVKWNGKSGYILTSLLFEQ